MKKQIYLILCCLTFLSWGAFGQSTLSQTFSYTGSEQVWVVPQGVTSIQVNALGAGGGNGKTGFGRGKGGQVQAQLTVTSGDTLRIYVGGQGASHLGGYNGGGSSFNTAGYYYSGGGGGATDIRIGGNGLTNRVIVAGGGGGSGNLNGVTYAGGAGGGLTAGAGGNGGVGATQSSGNAPGVGQSAGSPNHQKGGGGGGYYGGLVTTQAAGGGGGGSSYTHPTLTSGVVHTQGTNAGDGLLEIIWNPCDVTGANYTPTVTIESDDEDNIFEAGQVLTFSVATIAFSGDNPTYQWKRNGNNVGTNSPTFVTSDFEHGDVISLELTSGVAQKYLSFNIF